MTVQIWEVMKMSGFFTTAFIFAIGCSVGWLIEVLFRRFISSDNPERRWINPGFLKGPWLPLYGFGLLVLFALCNAGALIKAPVLLFVAIAVSMTALEYIAGMISTRLLKVRLWDYSREWGNFDGLICPKFSAIWAVCGMLYYYFLHPILIYATNALLFSTVLKFFVVKYMIYFFWDLALSLKKHMKVGYLTKR